MSWSATAEVAPPFIQTETYDEPSERLLYAVPEVIMVRADGIPEIHDGRERRREEALAVMGERYELKEQGREDEIPLEVNALGTANRVEAAKIIYGEGSPEHEAALELLHEDVTRLVGEAFRRLAAEYFPPLEHTFNEQEDAFFAHGYSTAEMTRNGLTVSTHDEEGFRRVNEFVEDGTTIDFFKLDEYQGRPIDEWRILSISECANWAIRKYQQHQEEGKSSGYGGYVPVIEKMALRMFSFDTEACIRYEEQMLMAGNVVTHETIVDALQDADQLEEGDRPDKTRLHGMQFIVHQSVFANVLDVASFLDSAAMRRHGAAIFQGEFVDPEQHHMDYSRIPEEARARQEQQKEVVAELMGYVLKLKEMGISDKQSLKRVAGFLDNLMHERAQADPDLAEVMYDKNTADNYRLYNQLLADAESYGDNDPRRKQVLSQAQEQLEKTREEAPDIDFCGAECGIDELEVVEKIFYKWAQQLLELRARQEKQDNATDKSSCDSCGETHTASSKCKKKAESASPLAELAKSLARKKREREEATDEKKKPKAKTERQLATVRNINTAPSRVATGNTPMQQ